ncbi:MAG: UDP-N-acetylmuramoyl-L-alanyl-D-glutamate--2,6-diaminopimelate ligase [Ardenticatenaceae bacterium]|nr:UDP-N-acetylmuramoyl-L-alanyl-D-glutamate--2,6-diaminopimelate ligase [Ardenticatenaceae bacterium]
MTISNLQSPISFKKLLSDWATAVSHPQPPTYTGPDAPLTQLTDDSRAVQPGACFVARVRLRGDGSVWSDAHRYIPQAIDKGARVIIAQRPAAELGFAIPEDVVYLTVPDTAVTLAWLAAAWYRFPSQQLVVIGITGTDGKSSSAQIIFSILQAAGLRAGMLSTIKAVIGEEEEPLALHVTTPEAPVIQQYLRRMVDAGLTHVVLETTSHALALGRVTAVAYDIAAVTNITHEHLDIHGSWENYFAAKRRLFEMVGSAGAWKLDGGNGYKQAVVKTAVLNRDDTSFARLSQVDVPRQLTYGLHDTADFRATDIAYTPSGTQFTLHPPAAVISSPLVGEFNVYNMLAATAVAHALHIPPETIQHGLQHVPPISGRMERIHRGQPFQVIVDFAHTPISLEKAIGVARKMIAGRKGARIIAVFGSAGQRDVEKRRLMAAVSVRDADRTILTAEDPRTESLDDILDLMAVGARSAGGIEGETFWRIPDRGQAIHFALNMALPDDIVLICGKGHEQSMCFGSTEYPWDDRQATRLALDAFLANQPMPDLGLPTGTGQ